MKILLCLLLTCLGVSAATPSFSSFNTNQFSTNNLFISIKDGAVITNLNIITDLFLNSTNIVNLFAPSSVTNSGDSLWFDVASNATLTNTMESMVFFHDLLAGDDDSIALDYFVTTDQNFTNYAGLYAPFTSTSSSIQSYTIFGNGGPTEENRVQLSTDATSASIQMLFNGVLTDGFNVATPSGYTGAGTLFLSDDGTYKAAGGVGGDSIWTNITGYVTMIPGQTATNTLAFTSGAADNATNVALRVSTANAWNNNGSKLADLSNMETNVFSVLANGTLSLAAEANSGDNDAFLASSFYTGLGYSDAPYLQVLLGDNAGTGENARILFSPYEDIPGKFDADFSIESNTNSIPTRHRFFAGRNDLSYTMDDNGNVRMTLSPTVVSTGTAVAYLFDTSNTLTNGDKFVSIGNAGTPLLSFAPAEAGNSAAQIVWGPGSTNVLSRSGSDLVYTNGSLSGTLFKIIDGSGDGLNVGFLGDNNPGLSTSGTVNGLFLDGGTNYVSINHDGITAWLFGDVSGGDHFLAGTDNTYDIGLSGNNRPRTAYIGTDVVIAGESAHRGARAYLASNATSTSTTPAALSLSTSVQNGKKYSFVLVLYCANSTAGEGVRIDFDGGGATATNFRAHTKIFDTALLTSTQTTALATDITAATITGDTEITVQGSFEPSSTGTFIPRFAENTSAGGTITVYRGSHLILNEIP